MHTGTHYGKAVDHFGLGFGKNASKKAVIVKALYGLKSKEKLSETTSPDI